MRLLSIEHEPASILIKCHPTSWFAFSGLMFRASNSQTTKLEEARPPLCRGFACLPAETWDLFQINATRASFEKMPPREPEARAGARN